MCGSLTLAFCNQSVAFRSCITSKLHQ